MYTMDNISASHQDGSLSPVSLPPHLFSAIKREPTDYWNPPLHTTNGLMSESAPPSYTSLETMYPDTSYVSSLHNAQYFTTTNSPSYIQTLYPYPNPQEDSDISLLSPMLRDVDLSYSIKDEGIGSSPSSFNSSSSPPLTLPNTTLEQAAPVSSTTVTSTSNFEYQKSNDRNNPEELIYVKFIAPECVKCGAQNAPLDMNRHHICPTCVTEEKPDVVGVAPLPEYFQNDKKRRRSTTTSNKKENQICTNCETGNTTLWRRSNSGSSVCNACGLYEKLHKFPRPKTMRKDNIQQRKRKPKATQTRQRKKNSTTGKAVAQPVIQRVQACSSINSHPYPLPTYNSLQMRNLPQDMNPAPLPSINGNSFFPNYRPEMYNVYQPVPPNEIMDNNRGLPTNYADS